MIVQFKLSRGVLTKQSLVAMACTSWVGAEVLHQDSAYSTIHLIIIQLVTAGVKKEEGETLYSLSYYCGR